MLVTVIANLVIIDLFGKINSEVRIVSFKNDGRTAELQPGETKRAVIALDSEAFEYYDEMIDELAVKPGRYQILYGTSSLDKDLQKLDFTVK